MELKKHGMSDIACDSRGSEDNFLIPKKCICLDRVRRKAINSQKLPDHDLLSTIQFDGA